MANIQLKIRSHSKTFLICFLLFDHDFSKNVIDVFLVSLLFTLNIFHTFSSVFIVDLEQVNVCWEWSVILLKKQKLSLKYFACFHRKIQKRIVKLYAVLLHTYHSSFGNNVDLKIPQPIRFLKVFFKMQTKSNRFHGLKKSTHLRSLYGFVEHINSVISI